MTFCIYKILVSGKVQGVFFRASAKQVADKLNLKGYAKNLPNGEVELMAQGQKENVHAFIEWCKQGPPSSQVNHIEYAELKTSPSWTDFKKL